jgi:hypothetical protein
MHPRVLIAGREQSRYDLHMTDPSQALVRRGPDQHTWYVVARAPDLTAAAIPAGLLRSAGIPVFLLREAAGSAIPLTVGRLGGVEVIVPEAYYLEARALLDAEPISWEELSSGDEEAPDDEDA